MTVKERRVLVGPGEGSRLPILDIVHKVTAGDSGGSLVIDEWVLHPGKTIPPPEKTTASSGSSVVLTPV